MVIVDPGAPDVTFETVRAALAQQDVVLEIVVVANDRADGEAKGSPAHPAAHLPGVRVVRSGRSTNDVGSGVAATAGGVIALLDHRARLDLGALAALVAPLDDPSVGAVTARIVLQGTDPVLVGSTGAEVTRSANRRDRDWGLPFVDLDRPAMPAMAFSATAAALRREAVADAGGWSVDGSFASYEDIELSFRLRRRGWSIVHAPEAGVRCRQLGPTGADSPPFLRLVERARLRFAITHGTPGVIARTLWRTFAGAWLLLLRRDVTGFRQRLGSLGAITRQLPELSRRRRALSRSATASLRELWAEAPAD